MKKIVLSIAFIGLSSLAIAQKTAPSPEKMQMRAQKRAEMQKMNEQKQEQHLAEMQKDLNLNKEQVAQINALQEKNKVGRQEQRKEMMAVRKEKMEQMQKMKQQNDDEMRKILTPDQYKKWEEKRAQKMEERKAKFAEKRGEMMEKRGKGRNRGNGQGQFDSPKMQ